ncbi:MAG: cell division protein FtsH, partial [Terriglobus roseus]|nr:cell division protein FtsH [Terriglobus roseus]
MNSTVKTILIWVLMIGCLVSVWQIVARTSGGAHDTGISLSQLQDYADKGRISEVTVNGTEVTGKYKDNNKETFHTTIPANYPDLYKNLHDKGVNVTIKDPSSNFWVAALIQLTPVLLMVALFLFLMRQMQSGGNKALSFGKSRARLLSLQQKKVTFKDVAGVNEAKEELKEII